MTRKTSKGTKSAPRKPKRLSLSKVTLKDLDSRGKDHQGIRGGAGNLKRQQWPSDECSF
jgi:hypothetical protein